MTTNAITEDANRASSCTCPSRCSHGFDPVTFRAAWGRVLGLAEWAEMIRTHMDHQAKLRQLGSANSGICLKTEACANEELKLRSERSERR
jgi:hypothetical protein